MRANLTINTKRIRIQTTLWNPFRTAADYTEPTLRNLALWRCWSITINKRGKNSFNHNENTVLYVAVAFGFGLFVFDWNRVSVGGRCDIAI